MPDTRLRAPTCALALAVALLASGACRNALPPWGASAAEARRNADNAFAGFSLRFTNVERDPKFEAARTRMGKYAFIPSRLYRDSSIWTVHNSPDSSQALSVGAGFSNGRYRFTARERVPYPRELGDERHYMRLSKLGNGNFEWVTIVDHGIGTVSAAQVGAALGALFTAFEGRPGHEVLADTRTTFRTTARHLGQLFRIDSLHTTALADGSTSLHLGVALQPDSMRRAYPAFAAYLDRYVMPSVYRVQLADAQGARYFDLTGTPGAFSVRLRARGGHLVSLTGPPRPLPDSLKLSIDFSAKFKIFRVGFRNMVGDLTIERGPGTRALMTRFRQEPDWNFPLAIDHLIKTPLRRPFEGRGIEMRLSVRDDLGAQAMSLRHIRAVVNESAIMRWLGNLGASAFGDFTGASEAEENRFLVGMFEALRRDFAQGL